MASKASSAPATVAEGLGNVLRAIGDTLMAPDATQYAGPLMKLQTTVLDMVHGQAKGGQQAPGAPAQGQAPPGPSPVMGGLAGMMGAGQGPSQATSGSGPSPSGMDPEQMRQQALVGADQ
jgi:hypothetical protein